MKDILMFIALFIIIIVMIAAPLLLVIKFQAYKDKKYYKLLATDFNLELSSEEDRFLGVKGKNNGCEINVFNDSFKNTMNVGVVKFTKQLGVKIYVHNPTLKNRNLSISSLKRVKIDFNLRNFEDYFEINLPENISFSEELKLQICETASTLGIEDRFDISQEENGALVQIQNFPLVNKKRYLKCKSTISFLINFSNYVIKKPSSELGNIINNIRLQKENLRKNRIEELNKLMEKKYIGKNVRPISAKSIEGGGDAFYLILKMENHPNETLFGIKTWHEYKHSQYIYLFPFGVEPSIANLFLKSILGDLFYIEGNKGNVDPQEFEQVVAKLKPFEVSGALD